jgi:ATP-dependent Clp protease ATP-binding subunit ClpA
MSSIFGKGKSSDRLSINSSLEGQTYSDIAEESHLSEGHIGDKGSELWKLLSDVLGVDISKSTARAILENIQFYNHVSSGGDFVAFNNVHICTDTINSKKATPQPEETQTQHLDLKNAPDISHFYGRTDELNTLEKWLIGDRSRLIAILGLNGTGKTALSRQLIEQIKPHFHYIIYRSLYFSPTLDKLLTQLLQIFPKSANIPEDTEDKISLLLNYFRQYRCLLILDDLHQLFKPEQLSGHYKTGCESYHLFFQQIA